MSTHISIGAVFARAWGLFKRRFVALTALALLQGGGACLALFWYDLRPLLLSFASDFWFLILSPALGYAMMGLGVALSASASVSMILVTREPASSSSNSFWHALFRRFLPALTAVAPCIGVIVLVPYGWSRLAVEFSLGPVTAMTMVGLLLAALALLIGFSSLVFVTLPAASLETGGPLRAIRRSLFLTAGQRWRLAAVHLILLVALVLAVAACIWAMDRWAVLSFGFFSARAYLLVFASALLTTFLLILTLVIASAYQQMVRLKDGITAEDASLVFE